MVINIIGDCDKRAVLYTVMKIAQTLGDVLVVTSSSRLCKLSDTRESGGHYQNTMICVTDQGIDDFFEDFGYSADDFSYVIIDNIVSADADLYIYVEGMAMSEFDKDLLEFIEDYATIPLYKGKMLDGSAPYKIEQFESLRDMCPVSKQVAIEVSKVLSKKIGTSSDNLLKMALSYKTGARAKPQSKANSNTTPVGRAKRSLQRRGK